jgi:hypothetical protein
VAGDRGRADVDRDAVRRLVETRPDGDHVMSAVDRHGHPVRTFREGRLERADDVEVGLQPGQLPLSLERLEQPGEVAGRRRELGWRDLDVMEADDRIDGEASDVEALAHDLPVDLALRRDVDEDVAAHGGRAGQPAVGRQALLVAIGRLKLGECRQVAQGGGDPVLGELADALADLATTADPAAAAD